MKRMCLHITKRLIEDVQQFRHQHTITIPIRIEIPHAKFNRMDREIDGMGRARRNRPCFTQHGLHQYGIGIPNTSWRKDKSGQCILVCLNDAFGISDTDLGQKVIAHLGIPIRECEEIGNEISV